VDQAVSVPVGLPGRNAGRQAGDAVDPVKAATAYFPFPSDSATKFWKSARFRTASKSGSLTSSSKPQPAMKAARRAAMAWFVMELSCPHSSLRLGFLLRRLGFGLKNVVQVAARFGIVRIKFERRAVRLLRLS
jgi:hypothetical protein